MTVEEAGAVAEAVKVTVALHVGLHGLLVKAEAVTPLGSAVRILKVTGEVVPDRKSVVEGKRVGVAARGIVIEVGMAARLGLKHVETKRVKDAVRGRKG